MAEESAPTAASEQQVDPKVVDAVTLTNVKTVGEVAAQATAMAIQNAVSNQQRQQDNATSSAQRLNEIANQATGVLLKRIAEVDVTEAAATKKVTEADLGRSIAELQAAIVGMGQQIKALVNTPPTGTAPSTG